MACSSVVRFMCVFVGMVLLIGGGAAALTCNDVIKDLKPCIEYLKNGSGAPPSPCCAGAATLASAATTTADKQTACTCLKNVSNNIKVNSGLAKSLPANCGITLPFEVSPNVDCSK